jgi:serine/threonine protein phosphatase PrpC
MLVEGVGRRAAEGSDTQANSGAESAADSAVDASVPAAITDTGCERELNEDRYAVIESDSGLAWVVCDGMGGAMGGELAAQLAIDAIRRDLENLPGRSPAAAIKGALLEANRIIVLRRQNPAFSGMGTTVVTAMFQGSDVAIAHAGDSRAYLIRDGAIQQLTTDHTYVQDLVDKGKINIDDALSHPQAHVLTRCIGSEPGLEIDLDKYWVWPLNGQEPQDFLLLCSDGLYSLVREGEMADIVTQHTPQRACVSLVELAKSRGGFDNVTVAIIPLAGQLRTEPPPGYEATSSRTVRAAAKPAGRGNPLVRVAIIVAVSVVVALGTVFGSLLLLSR